MNPPPHGSIKIRGSFHIQNNRIMDPHIAKHIANAAKSTVPHLRIQLLKGVDVIHEGKLTFFCESWRKVRDVLRRLPDPILPDGSLDFMVNYSRMGDCVTIHISPRTYGKPHSRVEKMAQGEKVHNPIQLLLFPETESNKAA